MEYFILDKREDIPVDKVQAVIQDASFGSKYNRTYGGRFPDKSLIVQLRYNKEISILHFDDSDLVKSIFSNFGVSAPVQLRTVKVKALIQNEVVVGLEKAEGEKKNL